MRLNRLALLGITLSGMSVSPVTLPGAAYAEVLCVAKTAKVGKNAQLALGSRMVVRLGKPSLLTWSESTHLPFSRRP